MQNLCFQSRWTAAWIKRAFFAQSESEKRQIIHKED